jgi:hypothetical protein
MAPPREPGESGIGGKGEGECLILRRSIKLPRVVLTIGTAWQLARVIAPTACRTLPSELADAIDAVRVIGNFAAHPIKSKSTGEIVPVEVGEAEWLLDVLEELFDFYFVRPAKLAAKRTVIDAKLIDAGKPPLK